MLIGGRCVLSAALSLALAPGVDPAAAAARAASKASPVPWVLLREVSSLTPSSVPRHSATVRFHVPWGTPSPPASVSLRMGSLDFAVPLSRGTFRGRTPSGGGSLRVRAVVRGPILRVTARVRAAGPFDGGVFAGRALRATFETELGIAYPRGPLYGLEAGELGLDGAVQQFVIAVTGRREQVRRPPLRLDPWDRNDIHRVRLRGAGLPAGAGAFDPVIQFQPRGPGDRWLGRVSGHALGAGEMAITATVDGRPPIPVAPLDAESLEIDGSVPDGSGVRELVVSGTRFVQARFDSAVPTPQRPGRILVSARDEWGSEGRLERRFVGLPHRTPVAMDVDVQVLEIREDGLVWSWGENFFGEVGDGTRRIPAGPVPLAVPREVRGVAAGDGFSLAVDAAGTVWRWGTVDVETVDRAGTPATRTFESPVPEPIAGLPRILAVAAGEDHGLALDEHGSVWAWGGNEQGQLGDGTRIGRADRPKRVRGLPRVRDISAGWETSQALDEEGVVWVWGRRLVDPADDATLPTPLPGLPAIRDIDARGMHLALATDGSLWTWGANEYGQLGDGTTVDRDVPARVAGIPTVVAADAGSFHALALAADGSVWAWGFNGFGELGDGTSLDRSTPVRVRDLADVEAIAAGTFVSLAVERGGALRAWGAYNPLEPGPVGWRSGAHGVYPLIPEREPRPGHVEYIVRPAAEADGR